MLWRKKDNQSDKPVWLCQASNMKSKADDRIHNWCDSTAPERDQRKQVRIETLIFKCVEAERFHKYDLVLKVTNKSRKEKVQIDVKEYTKKSMHMNFMWSISWLAYQVIFNKLSVYSELALKYVLKYFYYLEYAKLSYSNWLCHMFWIMHVISSEL